MAKTGRLLFVLACAVVNTSGVRAATFSVLHTFQYFPHGASPYAPLLRDANGNLYGTTNGGGPYNAGVVFKLDAAGNQTVMHTFTGGADGGNLTAGLVSDSAGNLYGTAYQGGIAGTGVNKTGAGVVYKIDTFGRYTVLYRFTGGADGSGPFAGVIPDAAGNLYGTTYNGGVQNFYGVVYKLSPSGQETVLYSFTGGLDGGNPHAGVTMDAAGNLYGTTYNGGSYAKGVVYRLSSSGQETVLFSFGRSGTTGGYPTGGVILDAAGDIFGAAADVVYKLDSARHFTTLAFLYSAATGLSGVVRDGSGNFYFTSNRDTQGRWPNGAVLKLAPSGKVSLLYQFKGAQLGSGSGYNSSVILDSAGNLYGTTPFAGTAGIVYEIEAGGKVKRLYDFLPAYGGTTPRSGLTPDAAGNLYGTTVWGGGPANAGAVYKLSPTGKETVLYTFKGGSTDGANPEYYNVVFDRLGNLYGVTARGGAADQGVVYELTPSGAERILHSFTGGADGALPTGLAIDPAGNLYGTTGAGGTGSQTGLQEGVVFKLDAAGNFSVLYSFTGLSDGGNADGGVVLDAAGNLYGTTHSGGLGAGTVFKIDTTGVYSVLHAFSANTDGGYPDAGVTLDAAGNLYGTCPAYGPHGGGTVFKLDASANFSVLYAFAGGSTVGTPMAGVARDAVGNLYGTISIAAQGCPGTAGSCGKVYRIDTAGSETVLHAFAGGSDGSDPASPVTLDGAGHLYGTADSIFASPIGGGVAFKITLP